ncbi:sirohydrochlorin cobaltochelatase [uncultured Pseudodesulfovibrio sp.]|uniref:sirohydrochlorin cobaltochelatase n=1 Tax=uncultured Pseudodesulfovibrio sp. TaxID=2035858 RepID=UPI0029C95352|nr:sirohydrochlorin cobaltochelatase [uncultured Pseudodesulfovibrio sp.]
MTLLRNSIFLLLALLLAVPAQAGHHDEGPVKPAIVLAAFGTSYPEAVKSILNIKAKVEAANPGVPVRLAFTSNIIRRIWQKRQNDAAWKNAHIDIPEEVLYVKHPLATIADLQNDGFRDITVQSLHVFAGEEFHDLTTLVGSLGSIRTLKPRHAPFVRLALGRPALGMPGEAHPYTEDLAKAAKTLKADVEHARKLDAALVYMGHGNDYFSTGIYSEFQKVLQAEYDYPIYIGCVEGFPGFDDMAKTLKAAGKKNILLKPFMIVAGDHATNDMAGDEDDSWKVMLTKAGYKVTPDLNGLGMNDAWAGLYVDHVKDAMAAQPDAK